MLCSTNIETLCLKYLVLTVTFDMHLFKVTHVTLSTSLQIYDYHTYRVFFCMEHIQRQPTLGQNQGAQ